MGLSGLHTLSFFDNNDDGYKFSGGDTPTAGTVVQANNLKGEGEITIGRPLDGEANPRAEKVYAGDESILEVMIYDDGVLSQLQEWMKNDRHIQCVGAGPKNLQWYEPVIPRVLPRNFFVSGRKTHTMVRLEKQGGAHRIYNNTNLLAYLGWADEDSDGIADGYSFGSGVSGSQFVAEEQLYTVGGDRPLYADILFPIKGISITASAYIYTFRSNTGVNLVQREYSASLIQQNDDILTGQGIASVSAVSANNIYTVRHESGSIDTASSDEIGIMFPALTTNGALTNTTEFMDY